MATPNIVPRSDSEGGLGTASKYWASAYIDNIFVSSGFVGRDADNNVDFSVDDRIQFEIAGSIRTKMTSSTFFPATNDGVSLGTASGQWSDLFLADGAVINFDNGEVTMTHSGSGDFTIASADDLRLQAGGNDVVLKGASGVEYGRLTNNSGSLTIQNTTADKDISLQAKNTSNGVQEYLRLDGSIAKTTVHRPLKFNDNISAEYGADTDMIMYHSGSNGAIENYNGNLTITNAVHGGDIFLKAENSSGTLHTYLQVDGGNTRINVEAVNGMQFSDNIRIKVGSGTGGDLRIYHNGTTNNIEAVNGNLRLIQGLDDMDITFESDDGAGGITTYFYLDGSSATHDGSATTNLYTNWPDNSRISFGTGHDLSIWHNAYNSAVQNLLGDLTIENLAGDKDIIFKADDGTGGASTTYLTIDGGDERVNFSKNAGFSDNVKAMFGDGLDLRIYHDGSHSYIQDAGTGHLQILSSQLQINNAGNTENMITAAEDGSVTLYNDGSAKLATNANGVSVTGSVSATSYKTGTTTVLQGDADVTIGSSGGTGTISLTTHTSTPFKIENDDSITMSPTKIVMSNLPTSDPSNAGQLWNDSGTLKISAG